MNQKPRNPLSGKKRVKYTAEEEARVQRAKEAHQSTDLDPEWSFIAEFGMCFGWEGIRAILKNEIDLETAQQLMLGAHKAKVRSNFDFAQASFIGAASSRAKRPVQAFKKATQGYMKAMK